MGENIAPMSRHSGGLRMKNENNDIDEELRILEQKIKVFNEHVKGFQKNMEQACALAISFTILSLAFFSIN
jgi:hypothetical protein